MAAAHGVVAVIPVNRLDRAKGRLADLLSGEERAALALATLETVVGAVVAAGMEPVVLTADRQVAGAVEGSARVLAEESVLTGLNAQLERALAVLGGEEVLVVHADLPLATGAALIRLRQAAPRAPSVTLVVSADGGTNAMLLRPPGHFPLAYGAGSAAKHLRAASAAGMAVTEVNEPSLALDLDTPQDIRTLLATPDGRDSPAGRLLESFGVVTRGDSRPGKAPGGC